jgi:hypothetical protein
VLVTDSSGIPKAQPNLVSNPATVAEIKRILEANIVGRENFLVRRKTKGKKGATLASESKADY